MERHALERRESALLTAQLEAGLFLRRKKKIAQNLSYIVLGVNSMSKTQIVKLLEQNIELLNQTK